MKRKMRFAYILKILERGAAFFLALTFLSALSGCTGKPVISDPSKTVGVGRPAEYLLGENPERNENLPDGTGDANDPPPLDGVPTLSNDEIWWKFENGKYAYNFPEPDRSSLSDLTDINNTSRALFPDTAADDTSGSWWMGQSVYDASTGEVNVKYDRSATTIQLIKDNLGIYRGDESRKVCYFTFDCGYENGYTDIIMDVLKAKDVSGTFFITGQYVKTAQTQIRRMIDEGHIVGNHTNEHPNMTKLTAEEFIDQITSLEKMVKDAFPDSQPIRYYRPPEGATNEWALKLAAKMGIRTTLWSFTYKDYDPDNQLDYYTALEKVKSGLHPGCVYLFHAVSKTNSEILGEFIDWVRQQGYEILPLCDIDMNHNDE